MEFGQRLKALRLDRKCTQKDLAVKIGVTEMTIGNWERGTKTPGLKALMTISDVLQVSIDTLLGCNSQAVDVLPVDRRESGLLEKYRVLDNFGKQAVDAICEVEYQRINLDARKYTGIQRDREEGRYIALYTNPSAAGIGAPLEGSDFEMIRVDDSVPASADFAVRIQGDSMSPYIQDGQKVFVAKDARVENGDIGIFCVDGAMYCKQFYKDDHGNVTLLSANPLRVNANIELNADSGSTFAACGRVIMEEKVPFPDYFRH